MKTAMMNDPSLLRTDTILSAFSRAKAKVAVVTAKDKLRKLLGSGVTRRSFSAEQEGHSVYSATLSECVFKRGLEMLQAERPDLMYLTTSDYIQHLYPPGSEEANRFYQMIDIQLIRFHGNNISLVITADHGMNSKTDAAGRPCVIYLQSILD